MADFEFGKREWYPTEIECTRQCALRELFEECTWLLIANSLSKLFLFACQFN